MIGLVLALLVAPSFAAKPCPEALAHEARCGSVRVPENRQDVGGRTIDLNVVVLVSRGVVRHPPLVDLDGGPGRAASGNYGFYLRDGAPYREGREIVLFDQRGTGASRGLSCPELEAAELQYEPAYPEALVAHCRERLAAVADLTQYGTDAAAADLDAVRTALGAEQIDVVALSYGTTLALRYMTLYPARTHAAVLFGAVPPAGRPPASHAPAAESALRGLLTACAAEPACRGAFPMPERDLRDAVARLASIPGAPEAEVFTEAVRALLYAPASARQVPRILHHAASGDLAPFRALTHRDGPSGFAEGLYLTITCSESLRGLDYEASAAASRATVFSDYRLRRQRTACASWPGFAPARGFADPPAPANPLLLVSGELDPVTPPAWAEAIAKASPRARHVVVPGSGHLLDGMTGVDTCLDPIVIAFLASADPARIDARCIAEMRPPPFVTDEPAGY